MDRPPCWPDRSPCPNPCAGALYERVIYNRFDLTGPHWAGWRFRGRVLVSPEGDRISAERLRGMLWSESQRVRRVKAGLLDVGPARSGSVLHGPWPAL